MKPSLFVLMLRVMFHVVTCSQVCAGAGNFFFFHRRIQNGSGVHPALGEKRPEREADHLPPSSLEVIE